MNIGSAIAHLPVLSALAQAYFVVGDTGLKQSTELAFGDAVLHAEEIAAFVPVADNVIADASIDLWAEVREGLAEAARPTTRSAGWARP